MARILTSVNEGVFQINHWRGVNEAPEGEARLKYGEAAIMRNFRVTAGGALQKRPGSKNVAGLMQQYNAFVNEEKIEDGLTVYGLLKEPVKMFPRVTTDTVGNVVGEGDVVDVNIDNAADYYGYFLNTETGAKKLVEVSKTEASGKYPIIGGKYNQGNLEIIATGSENNIGGTVTVEGDFSIPVFENAACIEGDVSGYGESTEAERAFSTTENWKTQGVGGYTVRNGKLYKYYGAKTDRYTPVKYYKKYNAVRRSSSTTRYREGTWQIMAEGLIGSGGGYDGYTSYSFSSVTGEYSNAGSYKILYAGESGSVYQTGSKTTLKRIDFTANPDIEQSYYQIWYKDTESYQSVSYYYTLGDEIGSVLSPTDVRPEIDNGYTYVTTSTIGGVSYIIMRDANGNYFAYTPDETAEQYYICEYSWHGYALDYTADKYTWVVNPTYSENNGTDSEVRGLWSGFVAGKEVLCAACNGHLWELSLNENGTWSKADCGTLDTTSDVMMFGFDEGLYLLNGKEYKTWDGTQLFDVEGYRPMFSVNTAPTGGGVQLEQVNKLTAARRIRYATDGTAKTFQLPELNIASVDYAKNLITGENVTDFTADLEKGTVTFTVAPTKAENGLEIGWSGSANDRETILKMKFAEFYNGAQDTRVFVYGDGSNAAYYSGLDYDGRARADYFPDMNILNIGDGNTPITAMIRHYNKLLAFKSDSAYSVGYDTITRADGIVIPGFYISTVNRDIGNLAPGQARLVENRPRTLDARSVIEWKATSSSGNVTGDQRNADRVSQRVDATIRTFDLRKAKTYYDKFAHEYYVIGEDGTAIVNGVDADAWYTYTGLNARCLINYRDELYYGTADGYLRHLSNQYFSDEGTPIDAYWESGAMSFGEDYKRKYSAMLWVSIKPEDNGYLAVTAETDQKSEFAEYAFETYDRMQVPEMERIKLKAKKFTYYKLILSNNTADKTATVVAADIRVRSTGYVR